MPQTQIMDEAFCVALLAAFTSVAFAVEPSALVERRPGEEIHRRIRREGDKARLAGFRAGARTHRHVSTTTARSGASSRCPFNFTSRSIA